MLLIKYICRLVSAYEDKVLGLSENGEIFGGFANKTFPQFINGILNEWKSHKCNEHWEPQYNHCDFCEINYDIVGRVETLEEHLKYIAHINNFTSSLPNDESKFHVHPSGEIPITSPEGILSNNTTNLRRKEEKTINYFSMLNSKQLDGLYNMYQIDFELFGYSEYPYVKRDKKR
jgi:hypothetical protein